MYSRSNRIRSICFCLIVFVVLAACSTSTWRQDPAVEAARDTCGEDYNCYEREAVAHLNPEICRLVGIYIDDMCLQAVYEAADDPSICDRIYLQGVAPNCRAYYAQHTPASTSPTGTFVKPSQTQPPSATFTPLPTITPTSVSTSTATPTPLFVFDLSGYDPDIFQPIDLSHNPPLIARSDETVKLVFDLVNTIYCMELQRYCRLEPVLFYSFGDDKDFQSVPLTNEIVNGMESLVARLPATDQEGRSLRYYAEFAVPEAGYTLRYPVAGTIDLFSTANFISIELPSENAVEPGDKVYNFFWGYGPDKVRQGIDQGGRYIIAPPAMDVADDGRIALLDPVNERVLIYNPKEESYASVPLPFYYNLNADLAFDQDGQLMICDLAGEYVEGAPPIPYCYRLLPDGELDAAAPVYVKFPSKITKDLKVLDQFDYRLVAPFNSEGEVNSGEAQRQKETWDLPYRYVEGAEGFDLYTARFADVKEDVAFEVHSPAGFGGLVDFEKTPQGYLMVLGGGKQVRAVWIDPSGGILKDVTLQRGNYTEFSLYGQVAVAQDGSLYVLGSTERGIGIHYIEAPSKISAITYVPAGDALYLARTIDVQRNQDGIEQTLYTWPEAIPDLLADFSADGSVLAARMNNGDVSMVGLPQGELVRTLQLGVDFEGWPISLALSQDGSKLAVAAGENYFQIWDVNTGELLTTLTEPGSGVTYQKLSFSPDSSTLLSGFLNTITRWDVATGEATTFEPGCRGDAIFDLEYSPAGKQLAIACGPLQNPIGFLIIWDVINNLPDFQKEEILQMQHVAFSPDGAWLATGGPDGTVMLWEISGNIEPISFQSQTNPIYDLVYSPDGSSLVYATEGGLGFLELKDIAHVDQPALFGLLFKVSSLNITLLSMNVVSK